MCYYAYAALPEGLRFRPVCPPVRAYTYFQTDALSHRVAVDFYIPVLHVT